MEGQGWLLALRARFTNEVILVDSSSSKVYIMALTGFYLGGVLGLWMSCLYLLTRTGASCDGLILLQNIEQHRECYLAAFSNAQGLAKYVVSDTEGLIIIGNKT